MSTADLDVPPPTARPRVSLRMGAIMRWQGVWNSSAFLRHTRLAARQALADMVPPITQREWDEAWRLGDEAHRRHVEECRDRGTRRPRDREPLKALRPPPPSYHGPRPLPGDGAYVPQIGGGS